MHDHSGGDRVSALLLARTAGTHALALAGRQQLEQLFVVWASVEGAQTEEPAGVQVNVAEAAVHVQDAARKEAATCEPDEREHDWHARQARHDLEGKIEGCDAVVDAVHLDHERNAFQRENVGSDVEAVQSYELCAGGDGERRHAQLVVQQVRDVRGLGHEALQHLFLRLGRRCEAEGGRGGHAVEDGQREVHDVDEQPERPREPDDLGERIVDADHARVLLARCAEDGQRRGRAHSAR